MIFPISRMWDKSKKSVLLQTLVWDERLLSRPPPSHDFYCIQQQFRGIKLEEGIPIFLALLCLWIYISFDF